MTDAPTTSAPWPRPAPRPRRDFTAQPLAPPFTLIEGLAGHEWFVHDQHGMLARVTGLAAETVARAAAAELNREVGRG